MADFGMTNKGFIFPYFEDYKALMLARLKAEFGDDFEILPTESLGQFLEALAWNYEGFTNILKSLFANVFLFDMRGNALDRFGANYDIERLQGRKAFGDMEILGTPNYLVPSGFEFTGNNNLFYKLVNSVLLDHEGIGFGQIEASEIGILYNTEIGTIVQKATGDENVTKVINTTDISDGTDIESDLDYQERIHKLMQGSGTATANNIRSALLKLTEVIDCLVQENATNNYDNELKLNPGEIRVVINGIVNENVAYTIFNTKSAGIVTVGDVSFNVVSDSGQIVRIYIEKAQEHKFYGKIENLKLKLNSNKEEIETQIKANIESEIEKLNLSNGINYEKILAAVYKIDNVDEADISISINGEEYQKSDINIETFEFITYDEKGIVINYA